jgi:hypothetical protein
MSPDVQTRALRYRMKAENCFSIACSATDPIARAQWLDSALRWFRLAENVS